MRSLKCASYLLDILVQISEVFANTENPNTHMSIYLLLLLLPIHTNDSAYASSV